MFGWATKLQYDVSEAVAMHGGAVIEGQQLLLPSYNTLTALQSTDSPISSKNLFTVQLTYLIPAAA